MIRLFVHTDSGPRTYEAEDIEANETTGGGLTVKTADQSLMARFAPGNWNWWEMRVIKEEK